MDSSFQRKIVLITGASSGLGAAIARKFAEHGTLLSLTGRNEVNLENVAKDCKDKGAREVLTILADFVNLEDIKKVAEKTIEKYGKLDVLINNAGVARFGDLESVKFPDFDWMFQINIKSVVYLSQLLIPHLVKSKGNIVNLSSVASTIQYPQALIYGMTKSSLDQFTKTIALEYAPKGVRVNAVNPSGIRTSLLRHEFENNQDADSAWDNFAQFHPMGRLGTVEDVVSAVMFLASDASSWTTGQCLVLDGARSLNAN
ncbi:3-oxoacyl-[acyl-carrier-protein] reductase FabG-like [Styela clava]